MIDKITEGSKALWKLIDSFDAGKLDSIKLTKIETDKGEFQKPELKIEIQYDHSMLVTFFNN